MGAGRARSRGLPHHPRDRSGRPTALGPEPQRRGAGWRQHIDWESAGKQVVDARERLDIEQPGYGPVGERMARVAGLMPEQDRERTLERDLGWER